MVISSRGDAVLQLEYRVSAGERGEENDNPRVQLEMHLSWQLQEQYNSDGESRENLYSIA